MCGIFLQITTENRPETPIPEHQTQLISRRGPDHVGECCVEVFSRRLACVSSVLGLRGENVTPQPLRSDRYILQWNGEIFGYRDMDISIEKLLKENDTQFLMEQISNNPIRSVLSKIKGPWSVCIIDIIEKKVYFGRDYFGRRSLLFTQTADGIIISSVVSSESSSNSKYIEAVSGTLYTIDLKDMALTTERLDIPKYIISEFNYNDPIEVGSEIEAEYILDGLNNLKCAIRKRIIHTHTKKIGILFSGGIDSLLIAAVASQLIESEQLDISLDLINVAFEQAGLMKNLKLVQVNPEYYESVPDRIGGRNAFKELQTLYPRVKINFIAVNVNRIMYDSAKDSVAELLHPNNTVMDLSLGIVLWFGSRSGVDSGGRETFKVLLLGMGADEQLGGYSRHLSAFHSNSWSGLLSEMQMDLDRLGSRNLGRDDRCLSDHGHEARFPFLDEDFVEWLCNLPLRMKCDFALPKGQGDKRIFRLMALKLGFSQTVAFRPKKAMQFGAKSAKIASSNCKGDDLLE